TKPKNKVVVVAIDSDSVDYIGRWPWHRNTMAELIDKTIGAAVEAEKQKVLNGIAILEQKLLRALKTRNEAGLGQLRKLKEKFFPANLPQERIDNFSSFYLSNPDFIDLVMKNTNVFGHSGKISILIETP
ncbi:MAG: bacillithiol biosynthesis BshC, partial [Bacteroidia bacterium]